MSNKKGNKSGKNSNDKTKKMKTVENEKIKDTGDTSKTKKIKTVGDKETKKKGKKKGKHPKLMLVLKIILVLFVILFIIGAGTVAGIVFGLFGDDVEITKENLMINASNTMVYDADGAVIASLNGDENREVISLSEMGEYLPKAFVSIEDERFYEHNGVDIMRTASATVNYAIHLGDTSYGGSTITQQLIKNATKENEKDWTRKVKEIVRAFQVERIMSKDQILESYLNIIPLGGGGKNVHGVQIAARYYFDKTPVELDIAQCAYIAGITHAPNLYLPFKENPNIDRIKTRTKVVLAKMKELGKITQEQYTSAVAEVEAGIPFKEGNITSKNSLSWHTEAAINQIVKQMIEEKGLDDKTARARLYGGGYKIYTTQRTAIQNVVQEEYNKTTYIAKGRQKNEDGSLENEQTQSGMVIIDHKTGQVVGCAGGLGEKLTAFGKNRATIGVAQPGSAIKPLATIAPSLENGIITAASVLDDTPKSYGSYNPHNSYTGYKGLLNIRQMITISANVPEVKLLQKLTPKKSIEFMVQMGIETIKDQSPELSLVLGGTTKYVSVLEMASAYATIANKGEYIQPTFYTKVVDTNETTIMEAKQEKRRIMSEQNAYIEQTILKGPVEESGGTASVCKIAGIEVGAKTGSTDDYADRWLCGFTPYYTAATWFGYDTSEPLHYTGNVIGNVAAKIWAPIMKSVHKGLGSKTFEKPNGIVTATVCKDSGLIATDLCGQDPRGSRAYSEIFIKGTVPKDSCDCHVKLRICKDTGKIANEFCTNVEERVFITRKDSDKDTSWKSAADAQYMAPTETCTIHNRKADTTKPVITLKGSETMNLKLKEKFQDPGATAKDDVDGDITSKIKVEIKNEGKVVSQIDTSKEGVYIITYTVADATGNKDIKTRIVKITNKSGNNNTNTDTNNTVNNTTNTNNTVNNTTNNQ